MLTCPIALFFFMGLFSLFTDTLRTWKGIRGQNGLSLSICQVHCQHIGMYTMIDTAVRIMGSQNRPFGDHRTLLYRVNPSISVLILVCQKIQIAPLNIQTYCIVLLNISF